MSLSEAIKRLTMLCSLAALFLITAAPGGGFGGGHGGFGGGGFSSGFHGSGFHGGGSGGANEIAAFFGFLLFFGFIIFAVISSIVQKLRLPPRRLITIGLAFPESSVRREQLEALIQFADFSTPQGRHETLIKAQSLMQHVEEKGAGGFVALSPAKKLNETFAGSRAETIARTQMQNLHIKPGVVNVSADTQREQHVAPHTEVQAAVTREEGWCVFGFVAPVTVAGLGSITSEKSAVAAKRALAALPAVGDQKGIDDSDVALIRSP